MRLHFPHELRERTASPKVHLRALLNVSRLAALSPITPWVLLKGVTEHQYNNL